MLTIPASFAQVVTNLIPFSDSFEQYTNGTTIIGINGWDAPTNSCAVATNAAFTYTTVLPPLRYETHTNCMVLNTEDYTITNYIAPTNVFTNVWLDIMFQPRMWSDTELPATNESSIQSIFYVDTNGHLVIFHAVTPDFSTYSNKFTTLTNVPIAEDEWHRLTITMDYKTSLASRKFFKVQLDGGPPFTDSTAYVSPNDVSTNGLWFLCAYATACKPYMSSVAFAGSGSIDDFLVTNELTRYGWVVIASNAPSNAGVLSPSGIVEVANGQNITFTNATAAFWSFDSIYIDGVSNAPSNEVTFVNVTNDLPPHTYVASFTPVMATNYTPLWWLAQYVDVTKTNDAGALEDTDGDGITNWMEHLASTDPTNANSVFRISRHYLAGGTTYIQWVSSCIDYSLPPFGVRRTTNLVSGVWDLVDGNVTRTITNTWRETDPPTNTVPSLYRIVATNSI